MPNCEIIKMIDAAEKNCNVQIFSFSDLKKKFNDDKTTRYISEFEVEQPYSYNSSHWEQDLNHPFL